MLDEMASTYSGDALMTAKWLKFVSRIASQQTVNVLSDLYSGKHKNSQMISKITPNHLYALVDNFALNPYIHHIIIVNNEDQAPGYDYLTNCIIDIDSFNALVSARIAEFFVVIKSLSPRHQVLLNKCIR